MDYRELARQAALRYGYSPPVYLRQIRQESAWNPKATSPKGAMGLAQFMPETWKEWGQGKDPYDPEASLDAGARYMAHLLERYNGDYKLALAAYNAGMGNVDKHGGVPPFKETQSYVENILAGIDPRMASTDSVGPAVDPNTLPARPDVPNQGPDMYDTPLGIHPLIQQYQQSMQGDQGDKWIRAGAAVAGAGPRPLDWMAAAGNALTQAPSEIGMLQMLQASNELYKLEEARRERKRQGLLLEQQKAAQRRALERMRAQGKDYEADLIESGLLTEADTGDLIGIQSPGSPVTYGTGENVMEMGTWEDGTPKYGMVRLGSDGTYKIDPYPKGSTPWRVGAKSPELAEQTAQAKAWGAMRPEVIQKTNEALADAQAQFNRTRELLTDLEEGKYDGKLGPLRGRITQFFDPDVAMLRMQGINEALQNLNIANLAPVSNFEIGLIQQLYANPNMTVEQNKAVMKKLATVQQRKVEALNRALGRLRSQTMEEYMLNPESVDFSDLSDTEMPVSPINQEGKDPFEGYRRF